MAWNFHEHHQVEQVLSPQYLYPPNPSSTHRTLNKEQTPRKFPSSDQHQVDQNLSPQYLFPPNVQPVSHLRPYIIRMSFGNFEQDRGPGDQNLSPQYLFPPNSRSPSLQSESIAEKHWGVGAFLALLKRKPIEVKPWSLISLLDRLRYYQRPPFIISSRIYFNFYTNLLGTVAE